MIRSKLAILAALSALALPALAWHDTGHMVVADIAYRNLTEAVKAKVNALAKVGATEKCPNFLTSACWADDVKSDKNREWHYIDFFFRADGRPTDLKPPAENAVWAINRFRVTLADKTKSDAERAEALRFLLHLVGDLHQPLHCVARVTDAFPNGDRGGNDFKLIAPKGLDLEPRNLHFLWDMGCGVFPTIRRPMKDSDYVEVGDISDEATHLFPESRYRKQIAMADPVSWAKEGLALCKSTVYAMPEGTVPNSEYMEKGRKTCLERATIAGYRLAKLLNEALKR